jgi:hypothetical protein
LQYVVVGLWHTDPKHKLIFGRGLTALINREFEEGAAG